ncbi:hypothetical protein Ae201684_009740 [Aphanomyces euteiches]|uniref:Cytochrome P450 n=1 Tax=Aphanomyces euteiches TaxID=100861 RepID=A0A6G0X119_9STRA|nr:hypothetical protein Ae201684_009740 [Aphanomyces euteiches]
MIEISPLMLIGTMVIPGFLSFPIPSLIKRRKAQATLKRIVKEIIQDKLTASPAEKLKDLLDMMLPHSTIDQTVAHTVSFMTGGYDTSSNTLGFVFGTLASHPTVVAAVRAEYNKVISEHGSLTSWEAVNELMYTQAVIQETMRVNATAFTNAHRITEADDHVPMSDGSRVFIPKDFVLGEGLFSAEGKQHDMYRKLLNPLFTVSKIKSFVQIFENQTMLYCQKFLEPACDSREPVNLGIVFSRLTFSIIGLTVIGFDFDKDPSAIQAYEQSMIQMSPFMLLGSFVIPGFTSLPIPSLVKRRKAQDSLKKIMMQVIQDKLAASSSNEPKDLLDRILTNSSTEEALSHTVTFMLVGHDTSSNTLSFVIGMLASHPDATAAIRAEYTKVVSKYGSLSSWEAVSELQFTQAVIQETLRLNTVVFTILPRTTLAHDSVPMSDGSTVFIPKGTIAHVNVGAMNRNPKYWANPEKFIPDRFLAGSPEWNADLDLRGGKPHTYHYLPFIAGSKSCIGQRFAVAELQVIVATLVSKYEFTPTPKTDMRPDFNGVALKPIHLEMALHRAVAPSA